MTRDRLQKIVALALPIIGGMTSQNVLNLVDTAMVGVLGAESLAAVGLCGFLLFMATALVMGLATGVQSIAARRFGEMQFERTADSLNGGILLALVAGVPIAAVLYLLAPWLLRLLLNDTAVINEAIPYMQVRLWAIAAVGINFSFRGYWNATNRSRLYLYTLLIMHLSNVLLNYVLIFGHFGAPALGTQGAGLATVISIVLGTIIYFCMGFQQARINGFMRRRPGRLALKQLIALSTPASIQQFTFAAGMAALFWIIGQIGTAELAVANVLINITLVAVLPAIGLGLASATFVGQALGRRDPDDAGRWAWDVVQAGLLIFIALGLPMLLLPEWILGVFLHEDELLALGRLPLQMIGATIIIDGSGLIFMNSLLGAGDSRSVLRISIALQWALFLPLAWLVGPFAGLSLAAVWICFISYRGVQSLMFAWLWQRGSWAKIAV